MSSIAFQRFDETLRHEQLERALLALQDSLFIARSLPIGGSFWFVGFDGKIIGIIGFYRKKSVRYFAFAIYPEFRGNMGGQVFDLFFKLHCADSFCIKTLDDLRFKKAEHIYSKKSMKRYQLGNRILFVNGGSIFAYKVLILEYIALFRSIYL